MNQVPLFNSIDEFSVWRNNLSGTVGFVPTLGGIHDGHLSLIKSSILSCDYTIVSIFLNPLQFNKNEDLDTYPANLNEDLSKMNSLNVSAVFAPNQSNFISKNSSVFVNETILSNCIEGQKRPDFFSGVLTIVSKLFNVVKPTHSFFGKKDPQQLLIIKKLCENLNYNIKIVACDTVREKNGLAMSSRNRYLTKYEKEDAAVIFLALTKAKLLLQKNTQLNIVKQEMKKILLSKPNIKIDYISFSNTLNLKEVHSFKNNQILISIAVFCGKTRLIDSFFFPDF